MSGDQPETERNILTLLDLNEPLTDEEMAAFTAGVWDSWGIEEITSSDAVQALLAEQRLRET